MLYLFAVSTAIDKNGELGVWEGVNISPDPNLIYNLRL